MALRTMKMPDFIILGEARCGSQFAVLFLTLFFMSLPIFIIILIPEQHFFLYKYPLKSCFCSQLSTSHPISPTPSNNLAALLPCSFHPSKFQPHPTILSLSSSHIASLISGIRSVECTSCLHQSNHPYKKKD